MKKPRVALNYLEMALKIEKESKLSTGAELASTYLNLCAIHSELGQHQEGINKAVNAIMLIRTHLKQIKLGSNEPFNELETQIKQEKSNKIKVGDELGHNSIDEDSELLKLGQALR